MDGRSPSETEVISYVVASFFVSEKSRYTNTTLIKRVVSLGCVMYQYGCTKRYDGIYI